MDFGSGGYVLLRLPDGIELNVNTNKTVKVDRDTVAKLRQVSKPVLLEHFAFNVDGFTVELSGYSIHNVLAGVPTHIIGSMIISVVGDDEITLKYK